ncbi:MAG: FAD binding domain-containing protein [Anaerolineales bacterium]|nr:FAD binding domain-containing protein [Anaerolineales bacterium]
MIVEYFRPKKIEEAFDLLSRTELDIIPIGSGSSLDHHSNIPYAVMDLQDLGLNKISERGKFLEVGATVTLQTLLENSGLQPSIYQVIRHEATYNLRQVATVVGTLIAADARSPFATALLALDTSLYLAPGHERIPTLDFPVDKVDLGELLISMKELLSRRLVTNLVFPLNVKLEYEYVARTPFDLPIVCVALAQWPSGRTRLVLGGYGSKPKVVTDGKDGRDLEVVARNAYSQAGDEWASAEYRQHIAGILTKRCLHKVNSERSNDLPVY